MPVDDGAADHLPGLVMPSLVRPSTSCETVDLAAAAVSGRSYTYR